MILQHDNVRSHVAKVVKTYLAMLESAGLVKKYKIVWRIVARDEE